MSNYFKFLLCFNFFRKSFRTLNYNDLVIIYKSEVLAVNMSAYYLVE